MNDQDKKKPVMKNILLAFFTSREAAPNTQAGELSSSERIVRISELFLPSIRIICEARYRDGILNSVNRPVMRL